MSKLELKNKVTPRTEEYRENISLTPDRFGDWMCANVGTTPVEVDGYPLQPGEGLPWKHLAAETLWNGVIRIVFPGGADPGNKLRITRLQYQAL